MQKRPAKKKLPRDVNARAFAIGELATSEGGAATESAKAIAGRKGGQKGGNARAAKLSESRRKAIAKKAAVARWRTHDESP
jgi:hypothetical protein